MSKAKMTAKEFDRAFDDGESVIPYIKEGTATFRRKDDIRKVNVDMPTWMIERLDREAKRLGISRQAVIKTMIDRELALA